MALNIKDPATDRLARELARETGESITVAARIALAERLARVRKRQAPGASARLRDIIERGRARPVLDARSAEEILGYDERGLPS
jgi:antitoxin VapB